jgi:alpha-mannosidase
MEADPLLINNISEPEVIENGPVRAIYRFKKSTPSGPTPGSSITQDIIMYPNIDRIDIKTDINWDEQFKMLKVSFPLNVAPDSCTYEIPFGNISRSVTRNTPETSAKFEVYGHKWADMSKDGFGVSILNDSKYGWDALNNRLRLSLFKSSNDKDTRFEKGKYTTTYSIYPHEGDWKKAATVKEANEMNYPAIARQVSPHKGALGRKFSFITTDQPNIMITAIKKAEGHPSDLIVRIAEINGVQTPACSITFPGKIKHASTVNLIEDSLSTADYSGNVLTTSMHKYEIRSFRVAVDNPQFKDTRPQQMVVDLSASYNLDGISSNHSRGNGNMDGVGNTFSRELMPVKVVSEDVQFALGDTTENARNIVQCSGQSIKLPNEKYSSLEILAVAAGGNKNEEGTFKVSYKKGGSTVSEIAVRDWIAEFYELDGNLDGWDTPVKENIAYVMTHRHLPEGDDLCRTTYLFKYVVTLDPSKKTTELLLPENEKIKVLGITMVRAADSR